MNFYEKKLLEKINTYQSQHKNQWPQSLELLVKKKGRKIIHLKNGVDYLFYDLASLTKILFTTTMFMRAFDQKKILINHKVSEYLPLWPHKKMQIKDLLAHSSGLSWWSPYYKRLSLMEDKDQKDEYLRQRLYKEKINSKFAYSDLDFWSLGLILEEVYGKSLIALWKDLSSKKHFGNLHFNVNNQPKYSRKKYAPTEDCPWRKKILQAEVHDDNAWAMGGVAAHAGLFGGAEDVAQWGQSLRASYLGLSQKMVSEKTVKNFFKKQKKDYDWALGFMVPTFGSSSCGSYFSQAARGHTGFTGTSFWWDPRADIMIILLSNRVHPTRKNKHFVKLRPMIHNWVMEMF